MLKTSQGFHTFTISKRETNEHAREILVSFKDSGLRVRPDHFKNKYDHLGYHWIVEYPGQCKGITWNVRVIPDRIKDDTEIFRSGESVDSSINADRRCNIKATINPKIFVGIKDYLSAANANYIGSVEAIFNVESMKISRHLGKFEDYSLIRTDYCLNIDVSELGLPCNPEQIMKLIKRADIPPHYKERTEYSTTSHRDITCKDSFYIKTKSVVINLYLKYWELLVDFPECPNLEESRNILRFEIQYRYPKMYLLSKLLRERHGFSNLALVEEMLSDDFCSKVISRYFNRVVGMGNYYTLDRARKIIEIQKFKPQKEQRLISDLKLIIASRGIAKAKATLQGEELEIFRRSLRELENIGINPVTIPREWNIAHIPNILGAYYDKLAEEQFKNMQEEENLKILSDYYKESYDTYTPNYKKHPLNNAGITISRYSPEETSI